jgi:hypothetical protein
MTEKEYMLAALKTHLRSALSSVSEASAYKYGIEGKPNENEVSRQMQTAYNALEEAITSISEVMKFDLVKETS